MHAFILLTYKPSALTHPNATFPSANTQMSCKVAGKGIDVFNTCKSILSKRLEFIVNDPFLANLEFEKTHASALNCSIFNSNVLEIYIVINSFFQLLNMYNRGLSIKQAYIAAIAWYSAVLRKRFDMFK